jgi:S1-C subfamily serine protease
VARGSAAERRGVAAYRGTKLIQINDQRIQLPSDVRTALDGIETGQIISLHFLDRIGEERVVNVRMP